MNPDWLVDEASFAAICDVYVPSEGVPTGAERHEAPRSAHFGIADGEEDQPDVEFLVDAWTIGVAGAAENRQRRRTATKSRVSETPAWENLSFSSSFSARFAASDLFAWTSSQKRYGEDSSPDESSWEHPPQIAEDPAIEFGTPENPLTVESARRVLGVCAASTRNEIKTAYRKMAHRYHPDRRSLNSDSFDVRSANDRMARINDAYRLLWAALS